MTNTTKAHYEVLKHILRYLEGVKHLRLTWCASAPLKKGFKLFQIYSFADTSWVDDKNLARVLVATLYSCIILPLLCVVSTLLELVLVPKRFNPVGN